MADIASCALCGAIDNLTSPMGRGYVCADVKACIERADIEPPYAGFMLGFRTGFDAGVSAGGAHKGASAVKRVDDAPKQGARLRRLQKPTGEFVNVTYHEHARNDWQPHIHDRYPEHLHQQFGFVHKIYTLTESSKADDAAAALTANAGNAESEAGRAAALTDLQTDFDAGGQGQCARAEQAQRARAAANAPDNPHPDCANGCKRPGKWQGDDCQFVCVLSAPVNADNLDAKVAAHRAAQAVKPAHPDCAEFCQWDDSDCRRDCRKARQSAAALTANAGKKDEFIAALAVADWRADGQPADMMPYKRAARDEYRRLAALAAADIVSAQAEGALILSDLTATA